MASRNRGATPANTITYRPKRPYALAVGLTAAIVAVGLAPAFLRWERLCYPLGWLGAMMMIIAIWQRTLAGLRVRYLLDEQGLTYRDGRVAERIAWHEIIACEVDWDARLVSFLTAAGAVELPLGAYDKENAEAILTQIYHRVPEGSMGPKEYSTKPEYQAAMERAWAEWAVPARPLVIGDPAMHRIAGWACVGLSTYFTVLFSAIEETRGSGAIWVFVFFALLGLLLLALDGQTSANADYLMRQVLFGRLRYRLAWGEVERIEWAKNGQQMVAFGRGKRLAIPDPRQGRGPEKARLLEFIATQIEQRAIPVKTTTRAYFLTSRGVRVKSRDTRRPS